MRRETQMNKAMANYWVDMLIGVAFVLSAISGLVFLLPGDIETGVLWVSYQTWNTLHTWSSLAMIAGVVLSLLFSYVPGLRAWFDQFVPEAKRLIMLVLLGLTTGAAFGLACAGIITGLACTRAGVVDVVWAFILAAIANQSAYSISPQVNKAG